MWFEKEYFREKNRISDCLTVILKTSGCYWAKKSGCAMCGYSRDSIPGIKKEEILEEITLIEEKIDKSEKKPEILKIFTSGSFFDPSELDTYLRRRIYELVENFGIKKLIVESRPEFVGNAEIHQEFLLEVGIGLETANDFIRKELINKGFTFEDFKKASETLRDAGISVKAYLLLKPPFLSEGEAIEDIVETCNILSENDLVDVVSLNLMNVQSHTYVEALWRRNLYRPPWLWSAVEVLERVKDSIAVMSDPVAAGKARGPHNCGKCDDEVAEAIRLFSLRVRKSLDSLYCDCRDEWADYIYSEKVARIPVSSK